MSLCINPHCPQPDHAQNDRSLTCQACGSELLLQGRYRVMRLLSDKSGFGLVYEAFDRNIPKILKVLKANYSIRPKAVELFEREARVLSCLHHPGIPAIEPQGYFQYNTQDGQTVLHCLMMEKIEGLNLREWMRQQGNHPINPTQALQWFIQLTEILHLVHQNHYFHRDIKPENIMLRSNGQLVLVDFGTVRQITSTYLKQIEETQDSTRIGSAGYTAPEQEKGQAVPQSDFYALGCTLIFLLTGKPPTDFTIYDYIHNQFRWRQEAPTVPIALADLIDGLVATKVSDRPVSTQAILDRLHHLETSPLPLPNPVGMARSTLELNTNSETTLESPSESPSGSPLGSLSGSRSEFAAKFPFKQVTKVGLGVGAIAILTIATLSVAYYTPPFKILVNHLFPNYTPAKDFADVRSLKGHTGFVNALELSPDGQLLVSGGADQLIKIWNFTTGENLKTLSGHTSYVNAIAISPDGKTVVSGSADQTVKLWEMKTGKLIRTLNGHTGYINAIAISPDGRTIASAATDGLIKLWDISNGTLLQTLSGHTGYINAVAISPDGKRIVSGGTDKTLKIWDLLTGRELRTLIGHTNFVNAIALSPDGVTIISSSADQTLRLWELKTGKAVKILNGHTGYINDIAISPDGKRLISSSGDQTLKVWNLQTGEVVRTFTGYGKEMSDFAISPDWQSLAESSLNHRDIQIWSLKARE